MLRNAVIRGVGSLWPNLYTHRAAPGTTTIFGLAIHGDRMSPSNFIFYG
jgi:hypothetical protein